VNVKEWQGGRAGSLLQAGVLEFSPTLPEAKKIQQWYAANSACANFNSLSLAPDALTDLKALQGMPVPSTVELCAVLVSFKAMFEFTSQAGKVMQKRELTVADPSGHSLSVTIWGDRAQQDDKVFENNPVVTLKGVRVGEWNGGRQGSLLAAGMMAFNPSTPEAQKVQVWWSQGGASQTFTALSVEGGAGGGGAKNAGKVCTIAEMREFADQVGATPENFSIACRLAIVQTQKQGQTQPLFYMACQEPRANSSVACNRKVDESGFCAVCNRVGQVAPRLNIRCRFSDYSDSAWLTTFHEAAQKVLEKSAEEAQALEAGEEGREALENVIKARYFARPMQITVRAKQDTYMGEARTNISCNDARPLPLAAHGKQLLQEIQELLKLPEPSAEAKAATAGA